MRQTENFKLSLFDGSDPVSMAAMNANTEAIDAALQAQAKKIEDDEKSNAEQFGLRAKIATGSYIGTTATEGPIVSNSNLITPNYGNPKSSSRDLVFTTPFVPRMFRVTGMRSVYFNKTVTIVEYYEDAYPVNKSVTLSGYEYQHTDFAAAYGSDFVQSRWRWRYPYAKNTDGANRGWAGWELAGDADCYARVTFTENDDGTCTVTIHGTDSTRGTENYLDIEGMTYHWTAIG